MLLGFVPSIGPLEIRVVIRQEPAPVRRRHLCELLQGLDPRRLGAREGEDDGGGAIADGRAAEAAPDVVAGDAPTPLEIVPLLSCVLARCSILPLGGFSLAGGPDDQEIVRQHTESHLDPHTLQTPTTEPTQTPVGLGIGEPQLHRLAPLAVDRLGLGRLHLRPVRHDQILMFIPLDGSSVAAAGAPPCQRALLTMLLGTAIGPHLQRAPFGSPSRLLADPRQPMPLRAHIDLLLGLPDELALGDLPLRSLGAPLLGVVVLLIGGIQLHIRPRQSNRSKAEAYPASARISLSQTPVRSCARCRNGIKVPASVAWANTS